MGMVAALMHKLQLRIVNIERYCTASYLWVQAESSLSASCIFAAFPKILASLQLALDATSRFGVTLKFY